MNVLKITLNEDGKSVKRVLQDFNIIRGSYGDILISIEVPKTLLIDVVTDEDGTITTGNIVRIGGIIYTSSGKNLVTQSYGLTKIKEFNVKGIDYCLYQRKMPKPFTMWETVNSTEEGTSAGLSIKVEVVNFTLQSDGYQTEEISATSTITLDVYPGATLEGEEADDPTSLEVLESTVDNISDDVTELQKHISSLSASEISIAETGELTATTVQEAIEQLEARTDEKYVSSVTGEDDYLVDNKDTHNPIILHDSSKVDVTTFDETVEELNTAITTNANGISEINTNMQSYSLISDTGSEIELKIDTTNYVMTLSLKNATGEVISSGTIDFPLESMVIGASYSDGTLTLTLQNGTVLDIDISSIIDGLVNQTDFNALKSRVTTNESNISTNSTNIATNTANISQIQSDLETETTARETADTTLQANIDAEATARESADKTLQANIETEASARESADTTLQTNIDNLELASGATISLSIDSSTYVMTISLLNSAGTVLSTGTVDLPLETMVVSASYLDGMLYLTLQNGTTLEGIDISSIIDGLVSQSDFDTLSAQVNTNATNIATNTSDISDLKTQVDTNTSDIKQLTEGVSLTELQEQVETNTTNITSLTNRVSTAESSISTNTSAISDLETALDGKANTSDIPTAVSELTNDSGYITKAVSDLTNYYLKSETYTQEEVNNLVSAIPKFSIEVVDTLPTSDISETTVYLVKDNTKSGNLYTEYIYVNEAWELLGSQEVDLAGYVTTDDLATALESKQDTLTETGSDSQPVYIDGDGNVNECGNIYAGSNYVNIGSNTVSSSTYSTTIGESALALSDYGVAIGYGAQAGVSSTTTSAYNNSIAIGRSAKANSQYSTAVGYSSTASGSSSISLGYYTTASGSYSTAVGYSSKASGYGSVGVGNLATASKSYSIQLGKGTSSTAGLESNYPSFQIGSYFQIVPTATGDNVGTVSYDASTDTFTI